MPTPIPAPPGPGLRRRTAVGGLLAAGGAAALAGCTHGVDRRPARRLPASPGPSVEPDVALAAAVLADEQRVLDLVDATVGRHPQLAGTLAGARAVHVQHVRLLTHAVPGGATESATPSPAAPTSNPTATTTPTDGRSGTPTAEADVPADRRRAVAAVARAEDDLTLTGKRSAFAAQSGAFARVLASMAAASAQQAVLLREPGTVQR